MDLQQVNVWQGDMAPETGHADSRLCYGSLKIRMPRKPDMPGKGMHLFNKSKQSWIGGNGIEDKIGIRDMDFRQGHVGKRDLKRKCEEYDNFTDSKVSTLWFPLFQVRPWLFRRLLPSVGVLRICNSWGWLSFNISIGNLQRMAFLLYIVVVWECVQRLNELRNRPVRVGVILAYARTYAKDFVNSICLL